MNTATSKSNEQRSLLTPPFIDFIGRQSQMKGIEIHAVESYLVRKRITAVFGKYVAPEIVDQILKMGEEGLKLGGSRRDITVFFVDVRGFTPLS